MTLAEPALTNVEIALGTNVILDDRRDISMAARFVKG